MERLFSSVPGGAARAVRDDVLLSRLATQARPPLGGWPLGSRAAGPVCATHPLSDDSRRRDVTAVVDGGMSRRGRRVRWRCRTLPRNTVAALGR